MANTEEDDYWFIEVVCDDITAAIYADLVPKLGFTPAQMERLKVDHDIYGIKQVYRRMLQMWVNKSKVPATKELLADHFADIGAQLLAKKLRQAVRSEIEDEVDRRLQELPDIPVDMPEKPTPCKEK